jgi:hypothetical protein
VLSAFRPALASIRVCESLQPGSRDSDVGGPGPALGEAKPQPLGFPAAGRPGQGDHLRPRDQLAGQGHDLAPQLVLGEALEWEIPQPGLLGAPDAVLAPGPPVPQLQVSQLPRLVPVAKQVNRSVRNWYVPPESAQTSAPRRRPRPGSPAAPRLVSCQRADQPGDHRIRRDRPRQGGLLPQQDRPWSRTLGPGRQRTPER